MTLYPLILLEFRTKDAEARWVPNHVVSKYVPAVYIYKQMRWKLSKMQYGKDVVWIPETWLHLPGCVYRQCKGECWDTPLTEKTLDVLKTAGYCSDPVKPYLYQNKNHHSSDYTYQKTMRDMESILREDDGKFTCTELPEGRWDAYDPDYIPMDVYKRDSFVAQEDFNKENIYDVNKMAKNITAGCYMDATPKENKKDSTRSDIWGNGISPPGGRMTFDVQDGIYCRGDFED